MEAFVKLDTLETLFKIYERDRKTTDHFLLKCHLCEKRRGQMKKSIAAKTWFER